MSYNLEPDKKKGNIDLDGLRFSNTRKKNIREGAPKITIVYNEEKLEKTREIRSKINKLKGEGSFNGAIIELERLIKNDQNLTLDICSNKCVSFAFITELSKLYEKVNDIKTGVISLETKLNQTFYADSLKSFLYCINIIRLAKEGIIQNLEKEDIEDVQDFYNKKISYALDVLKNIGEVIGKHDRRIGKDEYFSLECAVEYYLKWVENNNDATYDIKSKDSDTILKETLRIFPFPEDYEKKLNFILKEVKLSKIGKDHNLEDVQELIDDAKKEDNLDKMSLLIRNISLHNDKNIIRESFIDLYETGCERIKEVLNSDKATLKNIFSALSIISSYADFLEQEKNARWKIREIVKNVGYLLSKKHNVELVGINLRNPKDEEFKNLNKILDKSSTDDINLLLRYLRYKKEFVAEELQPVFAALFLYVENYSKENHPLIYINKVYQNVIILRKLYKSKFNLEKNIKAIEEKIQDDFDLLDKLQKNEYEDFYLKTCKLIFNIMIYDRNSDDTILNFEKENGIISLYCDMVSYIPNLNSENLKRIFFSAMIDYNLFLLTSGNEGLSEDSINKFKEIIYKEGYENTKINLACLSLEKEYLEETEQDTTDIDKEIAKLKRILKIQ